MLPVEDADEYPDDVFVMAENPTTGRNERVRHNKGSFVFRLSGRDRQRSASYYTPEVLTRCVVHHALAELLGLDDYAPEGGSANIQEATELLDLTICEPALGSGAFLNEAINQLSAEYLKRRQAELGETLDPDRYLRELQKVKAHFALHQSYGVDLNATAVELAEVSLWLNAMHPGLKAPWLGLQLRRGNSLIGARRATWKVGQLQHRPWAETRKGHVQPPTDRPLADRLATEDDTAEAKTRRHTILKAPTKARSSRTAGRHSANRASSVHPARTPWYSGYGRSKQALDSGFLGSEHVQVTEFDKRLMQRVASVPQGLPICLVQRSQTIGAHALCWPITLRTHSARVRLCSISSQVTSLGNRVQPICWPATG